MAKPKQIERLKRGVEGWNKHWEEASDKAAAKERQLREEIEAQRAEIAKLNRQLAEGQGRR
jgi:predicted RNase H-like nuclease (RuvC/YqgF family)